MVTREFLTKTANGKDVYYDPVNSHAATHMADTPQLRGLVKEILAKLVLEEDKMFFDTNMGRIVGTSDLVQNDPKDEIVYAIRKNRDIHTSFNKTKAPQPSSIVAVYVERRTEKEYELMSAWIGTMNTPPFPGDSAETSDSKKFWMSHSLAWGKQEIIPGTETSTCPW
jgi:hypothetical protein